MDAATPTATTSTQRCALHVNLFTVLDDFAKLHVDRQLALLEWAADYIPTRHLVHSLFREQYEEHKQRGTASEKGRRRKVYKLVNSSSGRSVAKLYRSFWRFLTGYSDSCELSENDAQTHTTRSVHTNYSCGDTLEMGEEEAELNAGHRPSTVDTVSFHDYDHSTMGTYDASRCIDVAVMLEKPVTVLPPPSIVQQTPELFARKWKLQQQQQHSKKSKRNLNDCYDDDDDDSLDEEDSALRRVVAYLEHPIHRHAIKLLDFVLVSGDECWELWGETVRRALVVHREKRLYPIKDSLFDLWMLESVEDRSSRYVGMPGNGLLTKLGSLLDFCLSLRQLMRLCMVCGCYGMPRQATERMNYTQKHDCCLPATAQGVYQQIFLTSKVGHELMCTLPLTAKKHCLKWLAMFEHARTALHGDDHDESSLLRHHLSELGFGGGFAQPPQQHR